MLRHPPFFFESPVESMMKELDILLNLRPIAPLNLRKLPGRKTLSPRSSSLDSPSNTAGLTRTPSQRSRHRHSRSAPAAFNPCVYNPPLALDMTQLNASRLQDQQVGTQPLRVLGTSGRPFRPLPMPPSSFGLSRTERTPTETTSRSRAGSTASSPRAFRPLPPTPPQSPLYTDSFDHDPLTDMMSTMMMFPPYDPSPVSTPRSRPPSYASEWMVRPGTPPLQVPKTSGMDVVTPKPSPSPLKSPSLDEFTMVPLPPYDMVVPGVTNVSDRHSPRSATGRPLLTLRTSRKKKTRRYPGERRSSVKHREVPNYRNNYIIMDQ